MIGYLKTKQQGSTLIVALVLILVVTLLAVSSVKESTLESRMTGIMLDNQVLTNYAEAALREGELKLTSLEKNAEPVTDCQTSSYCFKEEKILCAKSNSNEDSTNTKPLLLLGAQDEKYEIIWYASEAPSSSVEDGNILLGRDTFHYEITAKATNKDTKNYVKLCSIVAKTFTN